MKLLALISVIWIQCSAYGQMCTKEEWPTFQACIKEKHRGLDCVAVNSDYHRDMQYPVPTSNKKSDSLMPVFCSICE